MEPGKIKRDSGPYGSGVTHSRIAMLEEKARGKLETKVAAMVDFPAPGLPLTQRMFGSSKSSNQLLIFSKTWARVPFVHVRKSFPLRLTGFKVARMSCVSGD
jgi:hypothetical protein